MKLEDKAFFGAEGPFWGLLKDRFWTRQPIDIG